MLGKGLSIGIVLAAANLACQQVPEDKTYGGNTYPYDFEAACANVWKSNECGDGDCADSEVEQRYADAWEQWYPEVAGLTAEEMKRHVQLRRVDTFEAGQSSFTRIYFNLRVDWVRLVDEDSISHLGGDPTVEEILDALRLGDCYPQVDFETPLVPYEEVQAFLDECWDTHDAIFDPEDWCVPWFPNQPGDDRGIVFHFYADLGQGDGTFANVDYDVTGAREPSCDVVVDP